MAIIGKNILENLTTGMYSDSKVIYREYIQNACDSIDAAEREGILDHSSGEVNIEMNVAKRMITISDNGTGISKDLFKSTLGDIANSGKVRGEDKGFRGIGRLCGLAYCKTLIFRSSYRGESVESQMVVDAQKMKNLLADPNKYSIDDVLKKIITYPELTAADADSHYFRVEMIGINNENTDLLDKTKIEQFLCFVAPVPFANTFILRSRIYEHAKSIGYNIDEYRIYVQGQQLFKGYKKGLYDKSKANESQLQQYDQIFDVEFYDMYDSTNNLIAWLWYGLCRFEKAIPKNENPMYGFRLRQSNIQIGDYNVIADLFKEDRGNSYFVGEIYAVHKELTPNSQRNYFSENPTRIWFENSVREYCYTELHKRYNQASVIRKSYKKLDEYSSAVEEYEQKSKKGFIDETEKVRLETKVTEAEKRKEEAKKVLDRIQTTESNQDDPDYKVRKIIIETFERKNTEKKAEEAAKKQERIQGGKQSKQHYFTDSLSKLDSKKRKLVAQIMGIVSKHTSPDVLKEIMADVEKEFK